MKKYLDERIEKERNHFLTKLYPWQLGLLTILLILKLLAHAPLYMYILDMVTLSASIGYVVIALTVRGLLFHPCVDEQMRMNRDKIFTNGFAILFGFLVYGEFILYQLHPVANLYLYSYLIVWFIPALVATIVMLKKGWFVWGTTKRKEEGMKGFRKRVMIGALFFGAFVGKDFLVSDGVFHVTGILWVLGLTLMWGVLFYFTMKACLNISEKNADKLVKHQSEGKSYEEQENENCTGGK